MRSRHFAFVAVLLSVSAASAAFAAASLTPLGDLPGGTFDSRVGDVSGDVSTVVGSSITSVGVSEVFRTTDAEWSNPFLLAMAHWQLGDKDEARQWFDKGAQWMDAHNANSETMVRFRKEAAELLGVNEKKYAPVTGSFLRVCRAKMCLFPF